MSHSTPANWPDLFWRRTRHKQLCVLRLHPTLWHSLHGLLPAELPGPKNSERRFSVADNFHASFKQWCARIGSKTTWRTKHLECTINDRCQQNHVAKSFQTPDVFGWQKRGPSLENIIYNIRPIGSSTWIASSHHVFSMGKTIMS